KAESSEINPELNMYGLSTAINLELQYLMSGFEFVFRKNFNRAVFTSYRFSGSYIIAPDSSTANNLVGFANLQFDLAELYARKIRKEIFELKNLFSSDELIRDCFQKYTDEYVDVMGRLKKELDLGQQVEATEAKHREILNQLEVYAPYCYACEKPKKP
ncbi:MAG: hypothetical protein ACPF8V_11765, partial [Luteibaculum sp.]